MKKSINELSVGTLVVFEGEYAKVKECVHGNAYYALLGSEKDCLYYEYATKEELDSAEDVVDFNENHLENCCG